MNKQTTQFNIEITEVLQRTVTVTASSKDDAVNMVKKDYSNEKIVLDYSDHVSSEIGVVV